MTRAPDDEFAKRVADELHRAAESVEPDPAGLERIRTRTRHRRLSALVRVRGWVRARFRVLSRGTGQHRKDPL